MQFHPEVQLREDIGGKNEKSLFRKAEEALASLEGRQKSPTAHLPPSPGQELAPIPRNGAGCQGVAGPDPSTLLDELKT
jgi:hypothetical protein